MLQTIAEFFRIIVQEKTSRHLVAFLALNISFGVVELVFGVWTNSLGLISDAFHMFFDCTALAVGLAAIVISHWPPNDEYSYGFVRAEIIAGFVNGLFLLFAGTIICYEAFERAVSPPEMTHDHLLLVAIVGFLVNVLGIFLFHQEEGHSHTGDRVSRMLRQSRQFMTADNSREDSSDSNSGDEQTPGTGQNQDNDSALTLAATHGSSHHHGVHSHRYSSADVDKLYNVSHNEILHGVYLHVIADALGSLSVIVSTVLIQAFDWVIADAVCSFFISIMIIISVIPLLHESSCVLMQKTPNDLERYLPRCYQKILNLDGVLRIYQPHFWTLCTDVYVGSIKLKVTAKTDCRRIIRQVQALMKEIGVEEVCVQVDQVRDRPKPGTSKLPSAESDFVMD